MAVIKIYYNGNILEWQVTCSKFIFTHMEDRSKEEFNLNGAKITLFLMKYWMSFPTLTSFNFSMRKNNSGSGEMAQWLRALTALPEVLSSIPSSHMLAYNHLQWDLMPSSGVSEDSESVLI